MDGQSLLQSCVSATKKAAVMYDYEVIYLNLAMDAEEQTIAFGLVTYVIFNL